MIRCRCLIPAKLPHNLGLMLMAFGDQNYWAMFRFDMIDVSFDLLSFALHQMKLLLIFPLSKLQHSAVR